MISCLYLDVNFLWICDLMVKGVQWPLALTFEWIVTYLYFRSTLITQSGEIWAKSSKAWKSATGGLWAKHVILTKFLHPSKHIRPIESIDAGSTMLVKLLQRQKHSKPKDFTELGITIFVRLLHSLKQLSASFVTFAGIFTLSRAWQPSKQPSPMAETDEGMFILERLVQ